ncbi:amidase [Periconia macrospinosa]|uniref:Amidase n=1 Tax=Periconia macrospinosa TaxID=97972 RepID=A0A2V1DP59_9PLEO|nr:amidase [Periconia macrospinosa]
MYARIRSLENISRSAPLPSPPIGWTRVHASRVKHPCIGNHPEENDGKGEEVEWRCSFVRPEGVWRIPSHSVLHIPSQSSVLTSHELAITSSYTATQLVEKMQKGELKSVDVVTAFCKRASVAQQLVNCLTEVMFEEAIERAKECDEVVEREGGRGKGLGKLHGLPVSLKDSFNVRGTTTTIGYIDFLSRPPATTDSNLVALLRSEGAIFYCKTNLPQTMMTADTHNNVFGRTLNPLNLGFTAGGSTGGESALIAMGGSIIGLATDIAGSCRIPALCCGLFSFKPSAGRVPFGGGVAPGRLGSPSSIAPVVGPMGRNVRDLELMLSTIITDKTWEFDESVVGVPWRKVEPVTQSLRFGLIRGHPKRPLHPPIARALHSAATRLKEHGHEIVLLDGLIPDLWDIWTLACKFFSLDPKNMPMEILKAAGEPPVPSVEKMSMGDNKWEPTLDALFDMNIAKWKVVKKFHDLIVEHQLDAVLLPGFQATAVPHDQYGEALYTALVNFLNYPSAIIPYLEANKQLDEPFFKSDVAYEPPYNAELFEGMPAHVQVMGKPMQDEELMEILKVVEEILGKNT